MRRWLLQLTALALALTLAAPSALVQAAHHHHPTHGQIVGGTPVPNGQYPFLGSLQDKTRGGSSFDRHFCGGALIAPTWFLTAAHCVTNPAPNVHDLEVLLGQTVLAKKQQGVKAAVVRIVADPAYNPTEFDNDTALLELATPITTIDPIPFVNADETTFDQPGTLLTVAGWGNTLAQPIPGGVRPSAQMLQAQVPVVDEADCAREYAVPGFVITPEMLCAGQPGSGVDACQGDSGGPLFAPEQGGFVQVGIVSFGEGCADGFPGVYTRLSDPGVNAFVADTLAGG